MTILGIRNIAEELGIDNSAPKTKKAIREAAKKGLAGEALVSFLLANCVSKKETFDKWAWVNQCRIGWENCLSHAAEDSHISIHEIDGILGTHVDENPHLAIYRRNYNVCARWLNAHPRLLQEFALIPE